MNPHHSICLFERKRQRGKTTKKESTPCLLTLQSVPAMAGAGPGPHQNPGTQYRSPTWVAGTQQLVPSLLSSRVCTVLAESGIQKWNVTQIQLL